jgi:phenylalanyl-tRNA synthetase beta chain
MAERVLEAAGAPADKLMVFDTAERGYHPGRSGTLNLGPKNVLARFGELHPALAKSYDLPGRVAVFEIELDAIPLPKSKGTAKPSLDLPELMPVRRDFAFLYPKAESADALLKAVGGAERALITATHLFDVYEGAGVPAGQRSLGIEVTLQPRDKTLTDEDIDAVSRKIVAAAEKKGATLRG